MDYIITIIIIGIAALGMAWMPMITRKIKISYSLIYVFLGILLYAIFNTLPLPNPIAYPQETLHLTELVVITSIMGTGLKIDEPFSFRKWRVPFRLILITMILCIGIVFISGQWAFHFDIASALLLGAVLAPTDPVLASDVQVGPPLEKSKENVRFSLTAEAGMNDGTAFPFVWLAIALAVFASTGKGNFTQWIMFDLVYRLLAGVICGFVIGRLLAYLVFHLPEKKNFIAIKDGFVAIATTLLVYGLTELLRGYGFVAVFVTAITLRNSHMSHRFHTKLHDFTDQIERVLVAIVLILFGGSLVNGILKHLTIEMALFGLSFLFIIRPLTALIALIGSKLHIKEKLAISFFGIKGIGSFYYLAFALSTAYFQYSKELWSMVSFIVLISIIIHGVTATSVMKRLEVQFSSKIEEAIVEEKSD
ncbi:MAG TPA: cation:proton antiporter [Chitinophagaceae bacterium]|jgi:NhaP-type Na+/H+ and K+/H+ antiporters